MSRPTMADLGASAALRRRLAPRKRADRWSLLACLSRVLGVSR